MAFLQRAEARVGGWVSLLIKIATVSERLSHRHSRLTGQSACCGAGRPPHAPLGKLHGCVGPQATAAVAGFVGAWPQRGGHALHVDLLQRPKPLDDLLYLGTPVGHLRG